MALLAHRAVEADRAPERWVAIAHGIFGRGQNWRTFARKLIDRSPGWGALLLDIRVHGNSRGIAGPHSVAAAASDVTETLAAHGGNFEAMIGHSFGGKVTLAVREQIELATTWIVDSSPSSEPAAMGSRAHTAVAALDLLEQLAGGGFDDRASFVRAITDRGYDAAVGHFLAMNLERDAEDRFRLALDLEAIRTLLTDYFALDMWSEVTDASRGALNFAVAGRGSSLSAADQARLSALSDSTRHLQSTLIAGAGHWIHAEAPDALLDEIAPTLIEQ